MDLIYAARYTEVCDYSWDDWSGAPHTEDLPPGIWHVDTSAIPEFFNKIKGSSHNYIVVSPSCDFGICYQRYNHPALDLQKWLGLQMTPSHGYNDLKMKARIDPARCNEGDTYSIKCWSYTAATFPEIPDNVVEWFVANCEIQDSRVTAIPFGISGNKNDLANAEAIDNYPEKTRDKLLYINFQFYNTDRYHLHLHFKHNFSTLVTCKQQCPFDEFLEDMATHKYVLCPPGNGLDCYRTLESVYMGAIPILEKRVGCIAPYQNIDYPILAYPNLFQVDPAVLEGSYYAFTSKKQDLTTVKWPYWEERIESHRIRL